MQKEKIPIASDHKAVKLKSALIAYLDELGFEPLDLGTYSHDRVDYPVYAMAVAEKVSEGQYKKGIVLCKTGIGVSIVANKFPRIRAALVITEEAAKLSRKHNDSNILALGSGFVSVEEAKKILLKWLFTEYEGGRHQKRLDCVAKLEENFMHELGETDQKGTKSEVDEINQKEIEIGASLMCANQLNLLGEVNKLIAAGIDLFHIDIMDGIFTTNITLSPYHVFCLRSHTNLPIDVHLMVNDPLAYIPQLSTAGADIITIHVECKGDINKLLDNIKSAGMKSGLAIEVDTEVENLYPFIDKIDYALFLGVKTGFKAQPFSPKVIEKVKTFNEHIKKHKKNIKIMVDGAIGPRTITHLYNSGARIFIGGTSGLFKKGTYEENINQMKNHL